jgi:zinc and cadmium transporter
VTGGALSLEVFHIFEETLLWGLILIACGYIMAWFVEYLMPESHHHHDPHDHDHQHGQASARKIVVGDAIHNISDGIILVPAFFASPMLGLAVTVSIMVHEALQEISEFFVLKQAGYTTKKALLVNFLVASTIFVGIFLSYLAISTHELEGILLAVSAGFFLHVVIHDLFPKRHAHETVQVFLAHIGLVFVGLLMMLGVTTAIGDTHEHGEEHAGEIDHGEYEGETTAEHASHE